MMAAGELRQLESGSHRTDSTREAIASTFFASLNGTCAVNTFVSAAMFITCYQYD